MKNLKLKCPDCGKTIRVPFMHEATSVNRRTCERCRALWQIKTTPRRMKKVSGFVHIAEFVRVNG